MKHVLCAGFVVLVVTKLNLQFWTDLKLFVLLCVCVRARASVKVVLLDLVIAALNVGS